MDYKLKMYKQLALDFNVSVEDLQGQKNLFVLKQYREGRRIYPNDDCILQILAMNGIIVMSSTDKMLLAWCQKEFSKIYGAWICEFDKLRCIDNKLRTMGHRIADGHHYYIPAKSNVITDRNIQTQWYEKNELSEFIGDKRFSEAIGGDRIRPDMLAVAAIENGELVGMAGASADSPTAWQIGIDVLPQARNKGIGSYLVQLLKEEILKRGFLPFYGTGESHIQSQKVASYAGFIPAWWELYTKGL